MQKLSRERHGFVIETPQLKPPKKHSATEMAEKAFIGRVKSMSINKEAKIALYAAQIDSLAVFLEL